MTVYLVGAGPGNPDLITRRGLHLIRTCEVLLYDTLVADELIAEAPATALVVPRGPMNQQQINEALVDLGQAGLDVVRLKGGDPFVYGRGGEEALALAQADIPHEIVPGVSALAAVPAAAGIPITHRGLADTVTITTGHTADNSEPDYQTLAQADGTLVMFMALKRLPQITTGLIDAGLNPDTPAAVISNGTLPNQQTITAPLHQLSALAGNLPSPALLVIGQVVTVSEHLHAATQPAHTTA